MRNNNDVKTNLHALRMIPSELAGCVRRKGYKKLSFRAIVELAAPQTWTASIMPVVLATALSISLHGTFSFLLFYSLLGTSVFFQCAVNTLNDYSDFMSGVDNKENCIDPNDASIVYHDYEPVLAFVIGIVFLILGVACGLYAINVAGPLLILFGVIGAVVIFIYSFGLLPISYTSFGELISGVVMGGIIPFACFFAFTDSLNPVVFLYSVPLIITIGMIMLTNNGCDMEKDLHAKKNTLPLRIGRDRTLELHVYLFIIALVVICVIVVMNFRGAFLLLPIFAAVTIPIEYKLINTGLDPDNRIQSMTLVTRVNTAMIALYSLMIVVGNLELVSSPNSSFFSELFR